MFHLLGSLFSTRTIRGRYPDSRSTIITRINAGHFPPPIRMANGRLMWDDASLNAFDATLAGTGDARLAVTAALEVRSERARKAVQGLDCAQHVDRAIAHRAVAIAPA
jgi:hypothetical protein